MSTPAKTLQEIHRLRRFIKDLQAKLEDLPRQVRNRKEDIVYHEGKLKQAQDDLKKLKVKTHENDVTLKQTTEQIERYERQLNDIMSKKEFDALKAEIAHSQEKVQQLEDTILDELTEIDERTANLPSLENAVKEAKEESARFEKESEERQKILTEELERSQNQLTETENNLPSGDFRVQYQRMIRQMGEDAFASVKKQSCQACYTRVTAQQSNELMRGLIVLCKACGRILYPGDEA